VKTLRVMEARPAETPAQPNDWKLSFGFVGQTFAAAATAFLWGQCVFHKKKNLVLPRTRRWVNVNGMKVSCDAVVLQEGLAH